MNGSQRALWPVAHTGQWPLLRRRPPARRRENASLPRLPHPPLSRHGSTSAAGKTRAPLPLPRRGPRPRPTPPQQEPHHPRAALPPVAGPVPPRALRRRARALSVAVSSAAVAPPPCCPCPCCLLPRRRASSESGSAAVPLRRCREVLRGPRRPRRRRAHGEAPRRRFASRRAAL